MLNRNPLKRALSLDKSQLAALKVVLRLYLDPGSLAGRLPAWGLLVRPEADIRATAERIRPVIAARWPDREVMLENCRSQIGSGVLPVGMLPSAAVTIGGKSLETVNLYLRRPVIGRVARERIGLDCRCPEAGGEAAFIARFRYYTDTAQRGDSALAGRPDFNPVGAAERSRAGSTPALFRRLRQINGSVDGCGLDITV